MPLKLDCFGLTHQGLHRPANEDQFMIADLTRCVHVHFSSLSMDDGETLNGATQGQILMVADGLGGRPNGERASRVAIDTMANYFTDLLPWFFQPDQKPSDEIDEELRLALDRCQEAIQRESATLPDQEAMGTTLTMAWITRLELHLIHVGDSRAYLHREHRLRRITDDQTIQTFDYDRFHRIVAKHPLWSCLGLPEMLPVLYRESLQPADRLLLCTDGLTGELADEEIAKCLDHDQSASETCQCLVQGALRHGGRDNVTAVVAHIRNGIDTMLAREVEATDERPAAEAEPGSVAAALESELLATI